MKPSEFAAGPNQALVVYESGDMGTALDPMSLYGAIAADAEQRAVAGCRIVSMATVPLRHAAAFLGCEGSGYETKAVVAVVFAKP